jgi:hypothetical protein
MALPAQSGRMAPALQSHAPYTSPQTARTARIMTFPQRSFINTLPVLMASRHSRESGYPGDERPGDWMPTYAGMTFYWCRTYEMDI